MTNGSSFVQLGDHLIPTDGIRFINLRERVPAGTGTMVRVHLHTLPGVAYSSPNYLDFHGKEAQEIRHWAAGAIRTGVINVILEGQEIPQTAGSSD